MHTPISKSILSILLVSIIATMAASLMNPIPKASAFTAFIFNTAQPNTCNESGLGLANAFCSNSFVISGTFPTQTPPGQLETSNQFIWTEIIRQANDCDEFDVGDNNAFCANSVFDSFGENVIQTNNPAVNPIGFNLMNIERNVNQENDCNESGIGDNNVECANSGANTASDLTQINDATGDSSFDQDNIIDIDQRLGSFNTCDETQDGNNNAICRNIDLQNFVGPVFQVNEADGDDSAFIQDNDFFSEQRISAENDCDESGSGDNFALCENVDGIPGAFAFNHIDSVSQGALGVGDGSTFDQDNDARTLQLVDLENDCNESGDGFNVVLCGNINTENVIGDILQGDSAEGADSHFDQNNEIGPLTQDLVADNSCDETGGGDNFALCQNSGIFNSLAFADEITQLNLAEGDDAEFDQDNIAQFSQKAIAQNDCDEADAGQSFAICGNLELENFVGPVDQLNSAVGDDGAFFDQDNELQVDQKFDAENDCNEAAAGDNEALCENTAGVFTNAIESITQESEATGTGTADIAQDNEAKIKQSVTADNSCDESGSGINFAFCVNSDPLNIIGPIEQRNEAASDASDIDQNNQIDVNQGIKTENDCDESGAGLNVAFCGTRTLNAIESITQQNTGEGTADGNLDIDQTNALKISQNLDAKNDCDESGDGDNFAACTIGIANTIGPIVQTTDASAPSEDTDLRNSINLDQKIRAENDCDDLGGGDNLKSCDITWTNDIGSITQTLDGSTGAEDQNLVNIKQNADLKNDCDDNTAGDNAGSCTIDLSFAVDDITQDGDDPPVNVNQQAKILNQCEGGASCSATGAISLAPSSTPTTTTTTTTPTTAASTTSTPASEDTGSSTANVEAAARASTEPENTQNDNDVQTVNNEPGDSTTAASTSDSNEDEGDQDNTGSSNNNDDSTIAASTSETDDNDDDTNENTSADDDNDSGDSNDEQDDGGNSSSGGNGSTEEEEPEEN